jgi:hypothetical protein
MQASAKTQFCVQILDQTRPESTVAAEYYLMAYSMVAAIEEATERFQKETGKDINKHLVRAYPC